MTTPSRASWKKSPDSTPIARAKATPLQTPTSTSRRTNRRTFDAPKLRVAIARTVTVSACVPAFPPIDATIGIRTASATKARIVSVNCEITVADRIAVPRLIASHTNRPRAISKTPSDSSSSPTPASRRMSSSASSSSTSMASSMVMTPTSRPSASMTGAEVRWYLLNR